MTLKKYRCLPKVLLVHVEFADQSRLPRHMPGPKRTPRHLRVMRGTLQRCRDDTLHTAGILAFDGTPNPPSWMQNRDALDEWGRLAPLLLANRLLTPGNINALS